MAIATAPAITPLASSPTILVLVVGCGSSDGRRSDVASG
jgi:hypothetical protein